MQEKIKNFLITVAKIVGAVTIIIVAAMLLIPEGPDRQITILTGVAIALIGTTVNFNDK